MSETALTAAGRCACARGFHPAPTEFPEGATDSRRRRVIMPAAVLPCGKQRQGEARQSANIFTLCIRYEHGAAELMSPYAPGAVKPSTRCAAVGCAADGLRTPLPERELGAGRHYGTYSLVRNMGAPRGALGPGQSLYGPARSIAITSRSTTSTSTAMRAATAPTTRNVSAHRLRLLRSTGIRSSNSTRRICARVSTGRSQPSGRTARSFR